MNEPHKMNDGEGQLVQLGTQYVIEHRQPMVGEYIILPGPMWTLIMSHDEALAQQDCMVVVGMLEVIVNTPDGLMYRVRRLYESDGRFPPE